MPELRYRRPQQSATHRRSTSIAGPCPSRRRSRVASPPRRSVSLTCTSLAQFAVNLPVAYCRPHLETESHNEELSSRAEVATRPYCNPTSAHRASQDLSGLLQRLVMRSPAAASSWQCGAVGRGTVSSKAAGCSVSKRPDRPTSRRGRRGLSGCPPGQDTMERSRRSSLRLPEVRQRSGQ